MLLSIVAFAIFLMASGNMPGNALAFAGIPDVGKSFTGNLYEIAALVFDKEVDEIKDLIKTGQKTANDLIENFRKEQKEADDKKASKEELAAIKKAQDDIFVKWQEQFDELAEKANKLPEPKEEKANKSLMGLAEDAVIKLKSDLKEKNVSFKDLWNGSPTMGKEITLDLKAVSNMTTGYALTGANNNLLRAFELEPGVAKDPTAPLFITDLISVGATDAATIYWTERTLVEGGANQVAEAGKFPQLSVKWEKKNATAKKTAAYMKVTEEGVEDVDFMLSEMQDELIAGPGSIRIQLENQILTGDGVGENHKGLFTYAPIFAVPSGFQTLANPSHYDAVEAAALMVRKNNFLPTHMLVNPSDLVNMKLTKDANGNYIMPLFVSQNGLQISDVLVIQNNRVAEGQFLLGDMKRAKLFMKRALTIKFFDQNEDDGLNDLRTITGSVRAIFRVKGPDTKAFVKGTFATVKAAIKTV